MDSDRRWLARLVYGQRLLWGGSVVFALVVAACLVGGLLLITFYRDALLPTWIYLLANAAALIGTLGLAFMAAGAALVATPEPWESEKKQTHFAWRRFVARWGFTICVLTVTTIEFRAMTFRTNWVQVWLAMVLLPVWFVSAGYLFEHLAVLARRLPREQVGDMLGDLLIGHVNLMWGIAAATLAAEAMFILWWAAPGLATDFIGTLLFLFIVMTGILTLLFASSAMGAILDWQRELQRCWRQVRRRERTTALTN